MGEKSGCQMIHITAKALSIPPYLSTTWENISSLHLEEGNLLIVHLKDQTQASVPGLSNAEIEQIFAAHSRFISSAVNGPFSFSLPMKPTGPINTLGPSMEHNPEQSNLPALPPQVLEKLTMAIKAFGLGDVSALPKAEPHCTCVYCQVARALQGEAEPLEEVSDEDLKFRTWDIKQTGAKLYRVSNPIDANEYYDVFLGDGLGCTCASKNCEHIRAVLDS